MTGRPHRRRSGILVPLFSVPSTGSWGIGEIPDIERLAPWLRAAGQRVLQLLPIQEMPLGESSPYSALSAMAIDLQFIGLGSVADVVALGGEAALAPDEREELAWLRASPRVAYGRVRRLKHTVLRRAWRRFTEVELAPSTARARVFEEFCRAEGWWLDDYALFRALHERYDARPWLEWPAPLRDRQGAAIEAARGELHDEIGFRCYLQWLAHEQWADVRRRVTDVALFGDLPFTVATSSADVWARQHEFRVDVSVGVPPDAFSATGQDWNLPAYRWGVMAASGYAWLTARARRYAELYDGFRVDHLVGFYRTYFRTKPGQDGEFTPSTEAAQVALGERLLELFRDAGAEITAEDLGVIPDFVRDSLRRLGVPGYKVFRWERDWHREGQPFIDPTNYPAASVATTGTHDTETLTVWWAGAPREERAAVLDIALIRARLSDAERATVLEAAALPDTARHAFLDALNACGSDFLILPIQDAFGWDDRVNQPATIDDSNWTWKLPWPVDTLGSRPEAVDVARQLRELAERHGR